MWGSEVNPMRINVNGRSSYYVRQNPYSVLTHLRLDHEIRTLWVDAICINQTDEKERNQQVTQMGEIYSHAQQVILWLGNEDAASSRAMRAITKTPQVLPGQSSRIWSEWLSSVD